MKSKTTRLIRFTATVLIAVTGCFAPPAVANDLPRSSQNAVSSEQNPAPQHQNVRSARELIGKEVKASSGEELGKLKDFVIDTESGRVVYTIVSSGGVMGIGETVRAVPFNALSYKTGEDPKDLSLQIEQAEWDQTPKLREDQLATLMQDPADQKRSQIYAREGNLSERPTNQSTTGGDQNISNRPGAEGWMLASKIPGKNLRNGGEKLGEVEDVIIDIPQQTVAVLLDQAGALARAHTKFVVPFSQLQARAADRDTWTTSLTRSDLDRAQPTTRDLVLTSSMEIYRWNGPAPSPASAFSREEQDIAAVPSTSGNRDRWATVSGDRSRTIQDPGGNQTDVLPPVNPNPPVSAVIYALRSDPSLAESARNVEVTAEKDLLVLRGSVASRTIKDAIAAAAKEAAQGYPIDNQITVTGEK